MHYPCSENKGADQLRGFREADLRLCFLICKKPVFSRRGPNREEPYQTASLGLGITVRKENANGMLLVSYTVCLSAEHKKVILDKNYM